MRDRFFKNEEPIVDEALAAIQFIGSDRVDHDSLGRPSCVGGKMVQYDGNNQCVAYIGSSRAQYDPTKRFLEYIGDKRVQYNSSKDRIEYIGSQRVTNSAGRTGIPSSEIYHSRNEIKSSQMWKPQSKKPTPKPGCAAIISKFCNIL